MEKTMHELKTISAEAIPRALQKAERYRLLNQSWATESICLDILSVDPTNQQVLVMYLLSLTDQFGTEPGELAARAHAVRGQLTDEYQRWVYQYNDAGLKTKETAFNKRKQMLGRIEYAYDK